MRENIVRGRSLLVWILVPIGLLVAVLAAVGLFKSVTRPVLHPNPQSISSVAALEPPAQWSGAVDRARSILRAAVAGQNLPGLSVAVGAGGDLVWAEGFGWAEIGTRAPVTPNTRFPIGTASTMLTSAAAGVLLENGRLRLDDEIQTSVPQFPKKQWPVTLRQLMAHTAGVGIDDGDEEPLYRQRCEHLVEALPHIAGDTLLFEPGTQYRYSNYGWILVSVAVEAVAQQPFLTFMRDRIFQPLGMDHTGAESAAEENPEHMGEPGEDAPVFKFARDVIFAPLGIGPKAATGTLSETATVYSPGFAPGPVFRYGLRAVRARNLSCYAGSMAFLSTPSDLVRFGLAINGGTLLKPDTVRSLQTTQRLASGRETGHGLGWDLSTVTLAGEPARDAGPNSEPPGGKVASLMLFREAGLVVAVMSNRSSADTSALALKVADAFAHPASK